MTADEPAARPAPRTRRRLSRTFSRARWPEYTDLLTDLLAAGWTPRSFEDWLVHDGDGEREVLIRHDVDQQPRAALRTAEIEQELGIQATYYLRWRTASPRVIDRLRSQGHHVALHYETLTRLALTGLSGPEPTPEDVERATVLLHSEIELWRARYGELHSVSAHGDTRTPKIRNSGLVTETLQQRAGLLDAAARPRGRSVAVWVTDRSAAEGSWAPGISPYRAMAGTRSPILLLTHPNNWSSGASLWADRLSAALLPKSTARKLGITGGDVPPY